MSVKIISKFTGKPVTLLNPAEKARKAAAELKLGVHGTNEGRKKYDKNGKPKRLTKSEKAWRSGYLAARKDEAKAYKANLKKKNGGGSSKNLPVPYIDVEAWEE